MLKKKEAKRPVSSSSAGLAAIAPKPVPVLGWSTDEILENLDVKQAVALYKALQNLFGDIK